MKRYFLGIDMGTSSIRAVMFDEAGYQISSDSVDCSISTSFEGAAELDPEFVTNAVFNASSGCITKSGVNRHRIEAVCFSCHMHSLMLVGEHGEPLTQLMLWADTRAGREAEFIASKFDTADFYNRTGCRVRHPMYPLAKLLWIKNNHPDIFKKATRFITIKEYILFKLFGDYYADYTIAASQGYFNIHEQSWDKEILYEVLETGPEKLGTPVDCLQVLRGIRPEYAELMGLDIGTPVVVGSGDGIMANLGCGVTDDTALSSTIGTSGAVRTTVGKPLLDPEQRTWCYSFTKDSWVAGGAINNGGLVLKWLRETFRKQFEYDAAAYGENVYKLFDRFTKQVGPGSDGLIFLPYLTGERCPDWRADVRGLMHGLDYSHGRMHIVKAAMEGVMYRLYSVYEAISCLDKNAVQIRATGGYIRSEAWLQMQADIFNKEILVCPVIETSALGAAYLAMVAVGAAGSIRDTLPSMKPRKVITPVAENHEIYALAYKRAMEVYNNNFQQSSGIK